MKEEMPCFCKMIIPNPTIVHSSMCLWKLEKDEKKKPINPCVEVKLGQHENYGVGDFIQITGFHPIHKQELEREFFGLGNQKVQQNQMFNTKYELIGNSLFKSVGSNNSNYYRLNNDAYLKSVKSTSTKFRFISDIWFTVERA